MCLTPRKSGFNNFLRIATILGFKTYDEQQLDPDYVGYGFDPDLLNPNVVGVVPMKWPGINGFELLCYDFLKVHPLFINAGILTMPGEAKTGVKAIMTQTSFILNLQTMACEYREQNLKPTQHAIAAAAAVRANRSRREIEHTQLQDNHDRLETRHRDVCAQLEEKEVILTQSSATNIEYKNHTETTIADLKTEVKAKEDRITELTELNNLSPTKKMEMEYHKHLLDTGNYTGAQENVQQSQKHDLTKKRLAFNGKKIDLVGEQCSLTTEKIAGNARGDGDRTGDNLLKTCGQLISATDADKYDADIKAVTEREERKRAVLVEDHRIERAASAASAASNRDLQQYIMDEHRATKKNLADLRLKHDALKEETATESQLRAELQLEKEKNHTLEEGNCDLKLELTALRETVAEAAAEAAAAAAAAAHQATLENNETVPEQVGDA